MIHNIQQCDPHVLETIIEKYRKRNKALEKRESAIIKILANIDREKSTTSDIEDKIRIAISDSKTFDHDVLRPSSWSNSIKSFKLGAGSSDYYPRLSGRKDSYMPLPLLEYESVPHKRFGRGLDLESTHLMSWGQFPKQEVDDLSSDRKLNSSKAADEHYSQLLNDSSLDAFGRSYGAVFMSDSKQDCVRAASPEGRRDHRKDGGERIHRPREAMRSDPDVERLLQMTDIDLSLPCDTKDSVSGSFTDTVDSMMSFDVEPKRTFADDRKQPRYEQKEDLSDYMKDFISPSIQEMIHSYEQRHTNPRDKDDRKRNTDCDTRSTPDCTRRITFEGDSRPATRQKNQRGCIFPTTVSKSRRRTGSTDSTRSSSPMNSTTLGRPFSDSEKDTSNESIQSSVSRKTKSDLKSNHLAPLDCSRKRSRSQHSNLSDRQGSHSQQSSVHDDLELDDIETEPYEFEENYSNNYLKFLIRNCLPKSLLRSEYNSAYNWSNENKQDIFNRIEEIELIKKVICEELDYREFINKPFKLHRNDRRFLLRNIMYSEAVKLALSKGLPICGVMALFAETGSAENIKHLTLQTIRQANEILGKSHHDPSGLVNIVSMAEDCIHQLSAFDKKVGRSNPSKLCKILQDVISREPILDPRENLQKCIDEMTSSQVNDDTQPFDEVDSLRSEVCRLRNIIWSVEEHAALKVRRELTEDAVSCCSNQNKTAHKTPTKAGKHIPASRITRDDLTKEQARLKREVGRMKLLVHELEHEEIPRAISRKREARRSTARRESLADESSTSCVSRSSTQPGKSTERVRSKRSHERRRSATPESSMSSVASQTGSVSDIVVKERESLKNEVDRLRSLVENMERRLVVDGNESAGIVKRDANGLETASEDNAVKLRDSKVSTRACSSTQTTHSCTLDTAKKNTGHGHTRVIYLVAKNGEEASNVVKHCIRRNSHMVTKSISKNLQCDKMPNTLSFHAALEKARAPLVLGLTSNMEKESHQGKQEQVETTLQNSGDSVCTTRAKEQTVTPCENVNKSTSCNLGDSVCKTRAKEQTVTPCENVNKSTSCNLGDSVCKTRAKEPSVRPCENVNKSTSRNLPVIPETSDIFVSALSIPCGSQSTDGTECTSSKVDGEQVSADNSTCSNMTGKTNESKTNAMTSKRKITNPAENMWENMVDALIPGIASKRGQCAGEGATRAAGDSKEDGSFRLKNNPKEADDHCSNQQREETFFKIVHKSGSAYEISSSALLNENDQTLDATPSEECKKELIDDLSKNLALAVKICKGPESAVESLKEAFRESYVATCEKAINEALKDLINSYPLGNCDGTSTQTNKSKKKSKKRSAIELDDTTLSDCSPQYTRDDIVIVGTTEMSNGRNAANDPSFKRAVPNPSKKKQRALAAMQEEEIDNVTDEPSNTTLTLINSDEKECRSVVHEGSHTKIGTSVPTTPKDQVSSTPGKGIANRIASRYIPKIKTAKASLALAGRRVGNKSEPSHGIYAPRKKNIAGGTSKATKKTVRPFKLTSKEGNKMPPGDKATESSPGHKNVKSASFRLQASEETRNSTVIRSTKTPSAQYDTNSEVAVLFDGADRMEDKESNENAAVSDTEETPEMDCTSALKTVSRFEIGQDYKKAMGHVKNCPSCTKKLLPTLLQVVNKVEDMTRKCENPDTSKTNNLKGIQEQETKRPHALALRGKTR